MAKATHVISDYENFIGIVWETKVGRIITLEGKINPKMGFQVRDCETNKDLIYCDFVDVLADILPLDQLKK